MNRALLVVFIILLLSTPVFATKGHMKLLAVTELDNETYKGNVADLYLEIREGTGRVFLETFPATKMDTQISMRFAQQIACNQLQADCSRYDFIYTIRAGFGIVGGPSAGAAAAVLTGALVKGHKIDETVAITGTINSGGVIGSVGGIKEKIFAADLEGITNTLIPAGTTEKTDLGNIPFTAYETDVNTSITEVSTFAEAYEIFTGKKIQPKKLTIVEDHDYQQTMLFLSQKLCERTDSLARLYYENPLYPNATIERLENQTRDLEKRSQKALRNNQLYPAASFCFRANVFYSFLNNLVANETNETIQRKIAAITKAAGKFNKELNKKPRTTITDLQTYLIVKERLIDAVDASTRKGANLHYTLAFANERLFSVIAWSKFFKSTDKSDIQVDKESLKSSCENKIREAEERYQYVELFIPNSLESVRKQLNRAHVDLAEERFELCLFKASKAKAEANVLVGAIGAEESQLARILETKLAVAEQVIATSQQRNRFPIVGFSYYEYAHTLKETDPHLSLLFAEYALELSNLDIYFEKPPASFSIDWELLSILMGGLVVGLAGGFMLGRK